MLAMTIFSEIVQGDLSSLTAQTLAQELDHHLAQQYWYYEPILYDLTADELATPRSGFWLAYVAGQLVGCFAVRPLNNTTAELKRLYVRSPWRNQGIGKQLLATAESAAIAWDYTHLCLETGAAQSASIHLYMQAGFKPVPCSGKYVDPESLCYEKSLRTN